MRGVAFTFTPTSINSALGNCVPGAAALPPPNCSELIITDTVFDPSLATARSGWPELVKTSVTEESGFVPTGSSKNGENVPSPSPKRRATALSDCAVTAKSGRPSTLKSATAIEVGPVPAGKLVVGPNVPSPTLLPRRIETESPEFVAVAAPLFAIARSTTLSPLKSPEVTKTGACPVG